MKVFDKNTFRIMDAPRYVIGVDLAVASDYTVATTLDADSRRVIAIYRFRNVTCEDQIFRLERYFNSFDDPLVIIDFSEIDEPIIEGLLALRRKSSPKIPYRILRVFLKAKLKSDLIERLRFEIESGSLILLRDRNLLDELERYSMKKDSGGTTIYSAPDGYHDDCIISLALAVYGVLSWEPKSGGGMNHLDLFTGMVV